MRIDAKKGSKAAGKTVAKSNLPSKVCIVCNRPFTWRKKWEKCWDDVKYCTAEVGLLQPSASSEDIDGLRGQASHPAAEGIIGGRSQAKLEAYTFQTPPRSACGPYVAAAGQYLGFGTFGGLLAGHL
ncbi:g8811 [Coccomyxa viridis]|uniref:G8811 protein n=1 Tax=Coccomyxa viridis TaxID=1274662 RepID=A0ABP1G3Y6_9CHLO